MQEYDREISFERPPVVETVLGVQFGKLPRFTNGHLGLFWKSLDTNWTSASDAPPVQLVQEYFGASSAWRELGARLTFTQEQGSRLKINNAAKNRMVQIQNGRLHLNWLKQDDGEYPRYKQIHPEFSGIWQRFRQFVHDADLGELKPNQWEVTYVNEVPRGSVWSSPKDWHKVLPSFMPPSTPSTTAQIEGFEGQWHYEIEPQLGRLHVDAHYGRKSMPDGPEVIILRLTARGPISDNPTEGLALDEGLNCGRLTIVKMFTELTSEEAQDYWGRNRERKP